MFSQASVILFTGEGACLGGMHGRGLCVVGACVAGCMHGRGCAQQGVCMTGGGICGRGCVWQGACMAGDMHGRRGEGMCMAGEMATTADGTYPTRTHSYYLFSPMSVDYYMS